MLDIVKKDDGGNCILGNEPKLINSRIKFKGKNNRLVCEGRVVLRDSNIIFEGDNSIVFLSSNSHNYYLFISIYNNSVFFMDERTYMNKTVVSVLSEEKNVFIGKNCLFAKGIHFRVADAHLIYDSQSMERINESKSIYVGDHVWIGQDVLLLKGNKIGSGAIIGARSVVSNKTISSNSLWGGAPAREIRQNVFYDSVSIHSYTAIETAESMKYDDDSWIYKDEGEIISFEEIEQNLNNIGSVDEKIAFLISIKNNASHNRFFIDY